VTGFWRAYHVDHTVSRSEAAHRHPRQTASHQVRANRRGTDVARSEVVIRVGVINEVVWTFSRPAVPAADTGVKCLAAFCNRQPARCLSRRTFTWIRAGLFL